MPTPHGLSLHERALELAEVIKGQSSDGKPTLAQLAAEVAAQRAVIVELCRMIADQDIPSRSRGLSWSGDPHPGDVDAPAANS